MGTWIYSIRCGQQLIDCGYTLWVTKCYPQRIRICNPQRISKCTHNVYPRRIFFCYPQRILYVTHNVYPHRIFFCYPQRISMSTQRISITPTSFPHTGYPQRMLPTTYKMLPTTYKNPRGFWNTHTLWVQQHTLWVTFIASGVPNGEQLWVYVVGICCGYTLWVTIVYVVGTISCDLYVVGNIRCGHMLPTTYTVVPHNGGVVGIRCG